MKVILFDLGRTLEDQDVLLPGATEMLEAVRGLVDADGAALQIGLVSDYTMPETAADVPALRQEYLAILDRLSLREFFEPVEVRVTLSTELGVFKPDERVFRAALDKLQPGIPFGSALFVTEHPGHVAAARALGMRAVHFKGPGQTTGDIAQLLDFIPIATDFVASPAMATARGAWADAGASSTARVRGASWARFGDDVFLFGHGGGWQEARSRAGAAAMRAGTSDVPRDHLHLVIQKGRLFQRAFPDVPVLLDRGRFLIVTLTPERAARFARCVEPCFAVRPLDDRYVAFETRSRATARTGEVTWVREVVDRVSRTEYEADLGRLVAHSTRLSTSSEYAAAANWTAGRLAEMGYQTERIAISVGDRPSLNVVANRVGAGSELCSVVIVTAHLDSINHDGGPAANAPGADDNGSGSAGVLQIASCLRELPNVDDLRFILFGGEEQGLFGSKQYVDGLSGSERGRIRAVVNMDMIGCLNSNPASVMIEGAAVSQAVIDGLSEAAATYTGLAVEVSLNPFASDHVPFIDSGLPAVLTIEGADQANHNIHGGNDVIGNINYDIAMEILRMNVAFAALHVGRIDA